MRMKTDIGWCSLEEVKCLGNLWVSGGSLGDETIRKETGGSNTRRRCSLSKANSSNKRI